MANYWERAVPLAFHLCCFNFSAVLVVRALSHLVLGQDVEFDCIGSSSLSFYLFYSIEHNMILSMRFEPATPRSLHFIR